MLFIVWLLRENKFFYTSKVQKTGDLTGFRIQTDDFIYRIDKRHISNLVHLFCLKNRTNTDIFIIVIELEKYLIPDKYNPLKFKPILDYKIIKYDVRV